MGRKAKRAKLSARRARLLGTPGVALEPAPVVPVVEAAPVVEEAPVVGKTPAAAVAAKVKAISAPKAVKAAKPAAKVKPKTTKTVSRKRAPKKTAAKD